MRIEDLTTLRKNVPVSSHQVLVLSIILALTELKRGLAKRPDVSYDTDH